MPQSRVQIAITRFALLVATLMSTRAGVRGQVTSGYGANANGLPVLDCSAFVSSSSYTATNEPYQSRLHGCFLKNTYDVSQLPVQSVCSNIQYN